MTGATSSPHVTLHDIHEAIKVRVLFKQYNSIWMYEFPCLYGVLNDYHSCHTHSHLTDLHISLQKVNARFDPMESNDTAILRTLNLLRQELDTPQGHNLPFPTDDVVNDPKPTKKCDDSHKNKHKGKAKEKNVIFDDMMDINTINFVDLGYDTNDKIQVPKPTGVYIRPVKGKESGAKDKGILQDQGNEDCDSSSSDDPLSSRPPLKSFMSNYRRGVMSKVVLSLIIDDTSLISNIKHPLSA